MQMAYSLPRGSTTLPPIDALATVDGPGRSAAGFLGFKVYLTHQEVRQIAAGAAAAAVIPEPRSPRSWRPSLPFSWASMSWGASAA